MQEYQAATDTAAEQRRRILKDRLAETHHISGSAVVPNLENDAEWQKEAAKIELKYQRLLDEAKATMLKGQS